MINIVHVLLDRSINVIAVLTREYKFKDLIKNSFRGIAFDILGEYGYVQIEYIPTTEYYFFSAEPCVGRGLCKGITMRFIVSFKFIREYTFSPSFTSLFLVSKKETNMFEEIFRSLCDEAYGRLRSLLDEYLKLCLSSADEMYKLDDPSIYYIIVVIVLERLLENRQHNLILDYRLISEVTGLPISIIRALHNSWIRQENILSETERKYVIGVLRKLQ